MPAAQGAPAGRSGAQNEPADYNHDPGACREFHAVLTAVPPVTAAVPASYEDAVAELDELVAAMESGRLPLERMLASYERGAELLTWCRERLQAVEAQVQILEEGRFKPWLDRDKV